MKPFLFLICLFFSVGSVFAQNGSAQKADSSIPVLGSNAQGAHGLIVNKGNGHTEFITDEQYAASRPAAPVKSNVPQVASKKSAVTTASVASQKKAAAVPANIVQRSKTDSSASHSQFKQPPVLSEGPPNH